MRLNLKPINWILLWSILPRILFAVSNESFWSRDTLTGDWNGIRPHLDNNGVQFTLEFTQYYQGLLSGSGNKDFAFASRFDALMNFDTTKLGLWSGGGLHTHIEYRTGESSAFRGGALFPINTGAILPLKQKDKITASSIYLSQSFGNTTRLMLGKINALDLIARDAFFGGLGIHRFMNIAFVAPPSGVLPPVIIGGIAQQQFAPYSFNFMLYDPKDRTDDYNLHGLFDEGINVALSGAWMGKIANRSTNLTLSGAYSTKDSADLSQEPLEAKLKTKTKKGSYSISIQANHLLIESPISPGRGIGVYAKAAIADGNPNMIRSSFIGGLAGYGVIPSRSQDNFGVGYFYYNFSNDLQDALRPEIEFANEQGIELFYNYAITPWWHITVDLQLIDPVLSAKERAIVGGLRINLKF